MRKRPSSIDVARLAEVSQATVSYVLSNRTDKVISDVTRARVMAAAESLGYMPNRLADGILRGKAMTIGVVMPDFAHTFNSNVLSGLESTLAESGYRILIAHNRNDAELERHQVRMLMEHRVDGIIAVSDEATVAEMPQWVEEALRIGVAVAVIDDDSLSGIVDTVISDDREGSRLAVEHLIAQGHRRIAYLGAGERASSSRERRFGYEETLRSHGIEPDISLEIGHSYRTNVDPDLTPLLRGKNRATAVFSVSDGLVGQAMIHLDTMGEYKSDSLAFVGYGNLEFARFLSLTSIEQHPIQMGQMAAKRLLSRLSNEGGPPVTDRIIPELIVRRSSGPPKNS